MVSRLTRAGGTFIPSTHKGGSVITGASGALGANPSTFPLNTPTLTNSTGRAAGTPPVVLRVQWVPPSGDSSAGYYIQWEEAAGLTPAQNATTKLFTTPAQGGIIPIDGASFGSGSISVGLNDWSGAGAVHVRILRDNDVSGTTSAIDQYGQTNQYDASDWSLIYAETISVSVAQLTSTPGFNKSASITISNGGLTFATTAGNGGCASRTQIEQQDPTGQQELTVPTGSSANNTSYTFGIEDGTADLRGNVLPAYSNSTGIGVEIDCGGTQQVSLEWNARGTQFVLASGAGTVQDLDTFAARLNNVAHTGSVYRVRSGTPLQMGTSKTGLPTLSRTFGFAGTWNTTGTGTVNYGGQTFQFTGAGGANPWG